MDTPFFSVIIPTYNRSSLLKRAIDSVLNQTYDNFELIVVDDHSPDDTSIIIREISDPRFKYILNERTKGACGARNTGVLIAKGKWVAFLDDDDIWLPEKLQYQYELISKSKKSVGLVCTDYAIYKGGKKNPTFVKNRPSGWVREKVLMGGCIGCLSSICTRIDILININGFDEIFPSSQDLDLYLRIAEIAEFSSVPKTLVHIYQEKRDRIGQNPKSKLDGYIMLRDKYLKMSEKNFRLRYRLESRIFMYALLKKQKKIVIKKLPWYLFGFLVDFTDFIKTIRTTFILYRQINH